MKEAGVKSLAYDDAIYTAAGLTPSAIENSPALQAMLLQGADTRLLLSAITPKRLEKLQI